MFIHCPIFHAASCLDDEGFAIVHKNEGRSGAERSPSQAHSPTPKLEPVFWLEQYCCTRPSTWAVMARARMAARKQKPRKGSMLCIFFISPGGICGSARATAAAGEEPRNNTAPSPAYCARSEGMQRAVAMGGGFESAGGREDIGVVEV